MHACPRCGSEQTVPGHLSASEGGPATFFPPGQPFLSFKTGRVTLDRSSLSGSEAVACSRCGLVTAELSAEHLRALPWERPTAE